jgi:hypothetical protein
MRFRIRNKRLTIPNYFEISLPLYVKKVEDPNPLHNNTNSKKLTTEERSYFTQYFAVWRIRDVYPGSRIRLFSIPDPGSELSPSRILIKEFKYFNPKKSKKMVF